MISSTETEFERHRLSKREDAILSLAIEGLTDVQIAHNLDISQSTVNSYWVRIRGKLGQLSRTELVALALKQKHKEELQGMLAQSEELERRAAELRRNDEDVQKAALYHAALDAMPEAIFVCDETGSILYVNSRMEAMFRYNAGELKGQSVTLLIPERMRGSRSRSINEFLADPHPVRVGFQSAIYGRRKDDSEFRIMLVLDSVSTPNGPITTCVVRDFMTEVGNRRQYMAVAGEIGHVN